MYYVYSVPRFRFMRLTLNKGAGKHSAVYARDGAAKTRQIHFDRRRCRYHNNATEFYVNSRTTTCVYIVLYCLGTARDAV